MQMVPDALRDQVVAAAEERSDGLARTLSQFVQIPSINADYPGIARADVIGGETEAAAFISSVHRGFRAETDEFSIVEGRGNAVAVRKGTGGGRSLILNGHHDVVPPGDEAAWGSGTPFSGRVDEDRVWGRGTADMKGAIVSHAYVLDVLDSIGVRLNGDLILESVAGEETGQHVIGTTACIERGYRADGAIVSEASAPPIPLAVAPTSTGVLTFRVGIDGKTTHSGLRGRSITPGLDGPALAVSAIDKGFEIYSGLARLDAQWGFAKQHPLYEPGHFRIMPGVVDGAPIGVRIPYMVPDRMTFEYVVWHSPEESPADVREEIEACIRAICQTDGWLSEHPPTVEWIKETPPAVLDPQHPLCTGLIASHLQAAAGSRFITANAPQGFVAAEETVRFIQAGIPAVNYGPGDLRQAHAPDEFVRRDELVTSCAALSIFAMSWCGYTA